MPLKNWVRSVKNKVSSKSIADFVAIFGIIFAVGIVIVHIYQLNNPLPYEKTVELTDPVQLLDDEYKVGDTIIGYFEGERFKSYTTIFNRTLVCDDIRSLLKPVEVKTLPVGRIDTNSTVIVLSDDMFILPEEKVTPQNSCEIIYSPQSVRREYLLGGRELQNDQSFRTTQFDIVEEYSDPDNRDDIVPEFKDPKNTDRVTPPTEPVEVEPIIREQPSRLGEESASEPERNPEPSPTPPNNPPVVTPPEEDPPRRNIVERLLDRLGNPLGLGE